MLAKQDQRCAICCNESNGRQWHVDHCHEAGIVRGILCDNCNRGLGHFKDNPLVLQFAAAYLEKTPIRQDPAPIHVRQKKK